MEIYRGDISHTLLAGFPPHDIGKVAHTHSPQSTGNMPLIMDNEHNGPIGIGTDDIHDQSREAGATTTSPSAVDMISKAQLPTVQAIRCMGEELLPSQHSDFSNVTGATTGHLRIKNKQRRIARQATQSQPNWWTTHTTTETDLPLIAPPSSHLNSMCPQRMALHHPAAATLLEYATKGCPTMTGAPWSLQQLQAAIRQVPHASALVPAAMAQLDDKVADKVK